MEKVSSKDKCLKKLHLSFAAMAHLAEGLCLNILLTLKVDNSVCPVGTIYFALENINKK
jgi:hypothetical protein